MLLTAVAHAVSSTRAQDGCRYAVTMVNKGERGVLVWAGHLNPEAEHKTSENISSSDYSVRQTMNFTLWHDVRAHFEYPPYAELVNELIASYKRREWAAGITPDWAKGER